VRNVHVPATETTLKEVGAISGSTNQPLQRTDTRLRASPVPIRSPEASWVPTIPLTKIRDCHHPKTPLYLDLIHACANIHPDHKKIPRNPLTCLDRALFVPCFIICTLLYYSYPVPYFFTLFYLPILLLHPLSHFYPVSYDNRLILVNSYSYICSIICTPKIVLKSVTQRQNKLARSYPSSREAHEVSEPLKPLALINKH
jgi:hypothetical protein